MTDDFDNKLYIDAGEIVDEICSVVSKGGEFTFTGCGNSMYPFLVGGRDSVIMSSLPDSPVKRGDIVLYRRSGGGYSVHRVLSAHGGTFTMLGDSQYRPESGIGQQDIIAYVTAVIRKGKRIDCTRGLYRRVMTRYMLVRARHPRAAQRLVSLAWYLSRPFVQPKEVLRHIAKRIRRK